MTGGTVGRPAKERSEGRSKAVGREGKQRLRSARFVKDTGFACLLIDCNEKDL